MNNLQQNILSKIKAGEIDMKPKWHFVLRTGLLLSGLVTATLLVVYLFSFVLFFLRQSGIAFAPGFGFRGISFFVISSPWLLMSTSVAFLVLLYFLVKRYSFSYRQPLLYSMVGVVMFALAGSWLIGQTSMHQRIGSFVERNRVPVFAPMYRGASEGQPEGLVIGTITELTDIGFILTSEHDGEVQVILTPTTRLQPGQAPTVGEMMMAFGDRKGSVITAFGIRPYDEKKLNPPPNPPGQEGQLIRTKLDTIKQPQTKPLHEN